MFLRSLFWKKEIYIMKHIERVTEKKRTLRTIWWIKARFLKSIRWGQVLTKLKMCVWRFLHMGDEEWGWLVEVGWWWLVSHWGAGLHPGQYIIISQPHATQHLSHPSISCHTVHINVHECATDRIQTSSIQIRFPPHPSSSHFITKECLSIDFMFDGLCHTEQH